MEAKHGSRIPDPATSPGPGAGLRRGEEPAPAMTPAERRQRAREEFRRWAVTVPPPSLRFLGSGEQQRPDGWDRLLADVMEESDG